MNSFVIFLLWACPLGGGATWAPMCLLGRFPLSTFAESRCAGFLEFRTCPAAEPRGSPFAGRSCRFPRYLRGRALSFASLLRWRGHLGPLVPLSRVAFGLLLRSMPFPPVARVQGSRPCGKEVYRVFAHLRSRPWRDVIVALVLSNIRYVFAEIPDTIVDSHTLLVCYGLEQLGL